MGTSVPFHSAHPYFLILISYNELTTRSEFNFNT